jgi:hypothetical protein
VEADDLADAGVVEQGGADVAAQQVEVRAVEGWPISSWTRLP